MVGNPQNNLDQPEGGASGAFFACSRCGLPTRWNMEESHVESANIAIFMAAIIAITLACALVLCIYGYMDHTQTDLSVRVGNHDLRCLHQQCSETQAW